MGIEHFSANVRFTRKFQNKRLTRPKNIKRTLSGTSENPNMAKPENLIAKLRKLELENKRLRDNLDVLQVVQVNKTFHGAY